MILDPVRRKNLDRLGPQRRHPVRSYRSKREGGFSPRDLTRGNAWREARVLPGERNRVALVSSLEVVKDVADVDCQIMQIASRLLEFTEQVTNPGRACRDRDVGDRVLAHRSSQAPGCVLVAAENGRLGSDDVVGPRPQITKGIDTIIIGNRGHVDRLAQIVRASQCHGHMRDPEIVRIEHAILVEVIINLA